MRTKVLWGIVILMAAAGAAVAAGADDAKAGLGKRVELLKNVVVAYEFKSIPSQRVVEEHNRNSRGRSVSMAFGVERQQKFSYLDGKARYESKEKLPPRMISSDSTGMVMNQVDMASSSVQIVADGSREMLVGYRDDTYFKGFTMAGAKLEGDDTIDVPMGMRAEDKWVDAKVLAAWKAAVVQKGGAMLEFPLSGGRIERWSLSPEQGYAPAVQEVIGADGIAWSRTEMSDWKKFGDVWVAYKAVRTEFGRSEDGKAIESDKYVFTIKSCQVGSKENVPALYKMVWPDGTKVKGKDGKAYEAKGGELKPVEAKQTDAN
jgi:hypothetical protein